MIVPHSAILLDDGQRKNAVLHVIESSPALGVGRYSRKPGVPMAFLNVRDLLSNLLSNIALVTSWLNLIAGKVFLI